jgi:hypothetical protein
MNCKTIVLGLALLWSTSVFGQFLSPVTLNPNPALSTEQVAVEFVTGPCTAVFGEVGNPSVTVSGGSIDVLIEGIWEANIQLCFFPPDFLQSVDIGSFPPGDYTVMVRFRYERLLQPPQIEDLGTVDLTVERAPELRAVPSLSVWSAASLSILFFSIGVWVCGRYRY